VKETKGFFTCDSPVVVRCSRLGLGLQQRGYNRVEATGGRQVQRCACAKCHTNTLGERVHKVSHKNDGPSKLAATELQLTAAFVTCVDVGVREEGEDKGEVA